MSEIQFLNVDLELESKQDISVLVADIQESLHAIETYRGYSLKKFLREKEKEYIDHVLHMAGGNKEKAAEVLGVSLATFYRKYNDPAS